MSVARRRSDVYKRQMISNGNSCPSQHRSTSQKMCIRDRTIDVRRVIYLSGQRNVRLLPNLTARTAIFALERL